MALNFTMQQQQQTNWCWSACGTSTALFFDPASAWTQCTLANNQVGSTTCCDDPGPCNVYGYLDATLQAVGHFNHIDSSQEPEATLTAEIGAGLPLGVRVAWGGGSAHFIMCVGADGNGMVTIADPFFGTSYIPYSTLQNGYRGSGTWTHSYFTQA